MRTHFKLFTADLFLQKFSYVKMKNPFIIELIFFHCRLYSNDNDSMNSKYSRVGRNRRSLH